MEQGSSFFVFVFVNQGKSGTVYYIGTSQNFTKCLDKSSFARPHTAVKCKNTLIRKFCQNLSGSQR